MMMLGPSPLRLAAMSLVAAAFAALKGAHHTEQPPDPARFVLSRPVEPGPEIRSLAYTSPENWLGSIEAGRPPTPSLVVDRLP